MIISLASKEKLQKEKGTDIFIAGKTASVNNQVSMAESAGVRKNFVGEYRLSLGCGAFIFILFTLPGSLASSLRHKFWFLKFLTSDSFVHFAAMALFSLALAFDYLRERRLIPWFRVVMISLGYGIILEMIQMVIPGRTFDLRDMVFDAAGVIFILIILSLSPQKWGHKHFCFRQRSGKSK